MIGEGIHRNGYLKHYSVSHQILLVGEGDFSFALGLARSFGSATNIVATSLDSYDSVVQKYEKGRSNLENLEELGAVLLHKVDATMMYLHPDLQMRKFDRIIYNFPHAGFYGKEDQIHIIVKHRNLVERFLMNARYMLRPSGEIHVNHKTTIPFCYWNLEELGNRHSLELIECVEFNIYDYPGYENKRGAGSRCDEPFPLWKCSTFKFILSSNMKIETPSVMGLGNSCSELTQIRYIPNKDPHAALQLRLACFPTLPQSSDIERISDEFLDRLDRQKSLSSVRGRFLPV
ncbi:hypothetical protein NE237_033018 [Protea cynaroides]|uniref:25S rRNA (uridine-N(3))-methyltransferase BMT5-like domain-containing protein n=1 Tax=Protea cynaroides TaxID=273540 RepID=A0A9Q0L4M3_9MAGN|nr:hypothetical protein NE237_033018 [Protea cynaroides]